MWKRQNHSTSVFRSHMNVHFSSETINFHRITSDSADSLQKHKKDQKKTKFYWININSNIKFHISLRGNQIKSLVLPNSRLEFHFNSPIPIPIKTARMKNFHPSSNISFDGKFIILQISYDYCNFITSLH